MTTNRELQSGYQLISQQKLYKPEGNGLIYLKWWKRRTQTKNTLPNKPLIQIWWRNRIFPDKQKLREFSTTKPALQQMLKELL